MHILNPGLLGTQPRSFRERFAVPIERDHDASSHGAAAADHRAVRAAAAEDRQDHHRRPARQDRGDRALPAHPRAGHAVPGRRRRTARSAASRRGHRAAAGSCWPGSCGSSRSATIRHSSCATARRSPAARASSRATEELLEEILAEGDKVLCFTQFAEWGELSAPHWRRRFGVEVGWLHGGSPASNAMRWSRPSKRSTVRRYLPRLAQGRRHRSEPHRRVPRHPPSTAGGTRQSKIRPPIAPTASGSAASCIVHKLVSDGHGRGAHRRDDHLETGAGGERRRRGRGSGSPSCPPTICATRSRSVPTPSETTDGNTATRLERPVEPIPGIGTAPDECRHRHLQAARRRWRPPGGRSASSTCSNPTGSEPGCAAAAATPAGPGHLASTSTPGCSSRRCRARARSRYVVTDRGAGHAERHTVDRNRRRRCVPRVGFAAQLLAGEVPAELEAVFERSA